MTAEQLAAGDAFVNDWLGAPFTWNGRSRAEGTDCWGLAVLFAKAVFGRELTDWQRADHSRKWVMELMAQKETRLTRYPHPREACLVLVTLLGRTHHVGIFWRGGVFHAADGRGVVWERLCEFVQTYPALEFAELDA